MSKPRTCTEAANAVARARKRLAGRTTERDSILLEHAEAVLRTLADVEPQILAAYVANEGVNGKPKD